MLTLAALLFRQVFEAHGQLDAENPDTHCCLIKVFHNVASMTAPTTDAEKFISNVLEAERPTYRFLDARAAAAKLIYCLEPNMKAEAVKLIEESPKNLDLSTRNNKSEMIMIGEAHRMNSTGSLSFSGNSGVVNGSSALTGIGNSGESFVVDSVPELKHQTGVAVEWSVEEQNKLEEALPKYADEPGIIRYVKIASTLRNKTVRDVALRCRWMGIKRRKHEELNLWKKTKDKKDKSMESSSKSSVQSYSTINVAPFSVSTNHKPWVDNIHVEELRGSIRHLLEQNSQVLGQISTNICALKLQDNVDLFRQMKNNLTAILNEYCKKHSWAATAYDAVSVIGHDEYETRTRMLVRDGIIS
ncbi:hypothetical protein E3N88_37854 [Mikania micrantha]|uniref:Myb-like domain-containing protein n=1 Tax=Mikania micrantha TaxID=192012 RepID=A0A5N6LSA1_9ASTR|nr:hypothetical protein E3N88_37854 [Mikania micrantha]